MSTLQPNSESLRRLLEAATRHIEQKTVTDNASEKMHVVGAGGTLTVAYEQLRNAAEYAEEHMLLQRAIRRFYRRLFLTRADKQITRSGDELAVELTLAGYLYNDSLPETFSHQVNALAQEHYDAYQALVSDKVPHESAEAWTLDVLAVRIEWLINDPALSEAFVQFVYEYIRSSEQYEQYLSGQSGGGDQALYVAVQRALMKVDGAVIRTSLLERYQQSIGQRDGFRALNQQIDTLLSSSATEKSYRYVDRHSAPYRILWRMIQEDTTTVDLLSRPNEFLSAYESQVEREYSSVNSKINRGIIKSVMFLIITKVLIGLALEIPYDYLVHGAIIWVPLVINLLFPPLYMILLRMTLTLPGKANTKRLVDHIERVLYKPDVKELRRSRQQSFGVGFNIAYMMVFVAVFGGFGYLLWTLFEFELLHLAIFFIFLSGASFLGFRLSRQIRELEAIESDQNAITTTRDFLYMPFVVVGRFISEKYAKVNVVALTLDMIIELPLKTILRLIRQWTAFIASKKDAL